MTCWSGSVMHLLVPHRVGRNTSPLPRVRAYVRLQHAQHAHAALSDPRPEYPHLAALPAQPQRRTRPERAGSRKQDGGRLQVVRAEGVHGSKTEA
ncbi:hypothetical protein OOZ58_41910 [Streptomyces tauricus]|nr:hypothetical protein [Streptomyces tauricus]